MTTTNDPALPINEGAGRSDVSIDRLIATRASRQLDWEALAFQTKAGPQFRRAQIRYLGSGGTGDHDSDPSILASRNFTFSNMLVPPGGEGPEHVHHDVEEVFFVLEGELEVTIHRNGQTESRTLGYRDLILVPPGVGRSLRNPGSTDALFCVMLGARRPVLPTYPDSSPIHGLTRD